MSYRSARYLLISLYVALGMLASLFISTDAAIAGSRSAQVAGQFYPDSPEELKTLVERLLAQVVAPAQDGKPRCLIMPHAGYPYSGSVAAWGYRQVQGKTYDGVVVVAFTHRLNFPGASVDAQDTYHTPLGEIPVDQDAVAFLLQQPGIGHVEAAHAMGEHSLEVQLPFLQVALGSFKLIPILMGNARYEDAAQLAEALALLARRGDYLFVFSTDLSHYHPYEEAQAIDARTVEALLHETPQAVSRLFEQNGIEACGRGPIVTSLLLGARLGFPRRVLLQRANSGDTAGDRSRVVGYAAIGLYDRPPVSAGRISAGAGGALVAAARRTLEDALRPGSAEAPQGSLERYPELQRASGMFVTLRKRGQLRGCIGRIQTREPMADTVGPVALDAALRDHRFAPVTAEELPELHVEVSILTPPMPLADLQDLVPGRDGVILQWRGHSGIFLPQVWEESGWTRVEFLRQLASQKAGLPPDAWQQADLFVFQDQIFEE